MMPMIKSELLTLAGLHVTIGLAMAHDKPFEFLLPCWKHLLSI